jgi:hypothetical protein
VFFCYPNLAEGGYRIWDKQFEQDAKSGKLGKRANQAIADFLRASTKNYEALCRALILGIV